MKREPVVADSARLHPRSERAVDLNALFHAEMKARRQKISMITATTDKLVRQMGGRFVIVPAKLRDFVRREKGYD